MEREGRTGRRRITGRGAPVAVGHRAATGVLRGPNWFRAPRRRRSRGTGRPPASPAPGSIELATLIGRTQSIGVPLRRGRFGSAARSAYGDGPRGRTSPTGESRAGPCSARGALPRGRTRRRAVVRGSARSYLRAPPRYDLARVGYDRAHSGTTSWNTVRPRGAPVGSGGAEPELRLLPRRDSRASLPRARARAAEWAFLALSARMSPAGAGASAGADTASAAA